MPNNNLEGNISHFNLILTKKNLPPKIAFQILGTRKLHLGNQFDREMIALLAIKSGLMALLLLLLSNCSKESAIYIFVKNVIQKLSQLSLPHSLTLDMLNNQI